MNRLSTTKKMVEDLFKMNGNCDITIIDNNSTYPPLLDWYNQISSQIKIIRHTENKGCWSFFYSGYNSSHSNLYHVYSDADLELNFNMPYNWQEIMVYYVEKYGRKASLALKMSDIPDNNIKKTIMEHQSVCWNKTQEEDVYMAITDMTFTLDRKDKGYRYDSIRLAGNFECRHLPWYLDYSNLHEEEKYYLEHIDDKYPDALWSRIGKQKYKECLK